MSTPWNCTESHSRRWINLARGRCFDLADACLIWLAGQEKTNRVLTADRRDFSIFRTPDGRAFERVWLADEG